jgi:iron complex outermembrane recepter protein
LYANGSLNSAKTKDTHQWIANVPENTYAGGFIFNKYNTYVSLLAKHIGSMYGDSGETQKMNGYTIAKLSVSYKLKHIADFLSHAKISFHVKNLFDKKGVIAFAGYGVHNAPLYWTAPGRAYYVKLSLKFK